jgi:hypothetical protein
MTIYCNVYDDILKAPDYATAYFLRGLVKYILGDKQGAIADCNQAAQLFSQQGNMEMYLKTLEIIKKLEK